MTARKPKLDSRLAPIAAILQLIHGAERWRGEFARASGIPKPTVYSVFSGVRPLTDEFHDRLIAAIDAEIETMEAGVEAAKALREKLK